MKEILLRIAGLSVLIALAAWPSNAHAQLLYGTCTSPELVSCGDVEYGSTVGGNPGGGADCETSMDTSVAWWYVIIGTGGTMSVSVRDPYTNFDSKIHVYTGGCASLRGVVLSKRQ